MQIEFKDVVDTKEEADERMEDFKYLTEIALEKTLTKEEFLNISDHHEVHKIWNKQGDAYKIGVLVRIDTDINIEDE